MLLFYYNTLKHVLASKSTKNKAGIKMKYNKEQLKETRNYKNMPDVYVPYPLKFALKHDLSTVQALLYSIIRQYSKLEHKAFTGSIQTLQVTLNVSRRTVERELSIIIKRGFITKTSDKNGRNVYKCVVDVDKGEVYVPYPLKYAVEYGLTPIQTLIYSIIIRFSRLKYKAYTGSVATLKNTLNCSRSAVISALETLIIRGFIIKYKDLSANVSFVDGLSHKVGETEKELEFNALWVKENGTTRYKSARSKRVKGLTGTWCSENKISSHFENERKRTKEELDKLFDKFNQLEV